MKDGGVSLAQEQPNNGNDRQLKMRNSTSRREADVCGCDVWLRRVAVAVARHSRNLPYSPASD